MWFKNAAGTAQRILGDVSRSMQQDVTISQTTNRLQATVLTAGRTWSSVTFEGATTAALTFPLTDAIYCAFDLSATTPTSWYACRVEGANTPKDWVTEFERYTIQILLSPYRVGAAHTFTTKWGKVQTTLVGHDGDIAAPIGIVYEGPSAYYPLISDLLDPVSAEQITFTRALVKAYGGVSYPANVPIYDGYGIRITSDTSQDTPKVTLPTATIRTVAAQIKQTRYPSPWVIGAGAGTANLLTANQSNIETDTTGFYYGDGTLSRNTSSPIAGTADLKLVATGGANAVINTTSGKTAVTAGRWYCAQALIKTSGCAAGRKINFNIVWYQSNGTTVISEEGLAAAVDAPTVATQYSFVVKAPALAAYAMFQIWIVSAAANETLYVDSLMLEELPTTLTVWTADKNKLTVDVVNDLLKWTDDTTTVSATFPTASYMAGILTDVAVIDGASHAVTVIAHAAAGAWTTNTGTLAAIAWPELTLGNLEGSIGNLIAYPYALASAEYQAITYSSGLLDFSGLRITPPVRGTLTLTPAGELSCGTTFYAGCVHGVAPTCTTADNTTVEMLAGLAARWHVTSEDWYA